MTTRTFKITTLALLTAVAIGCERQAAAPQATPHPAPVAVGKAVEGSAIIAVRTVGSVEPIASVVLRPQISGQVVKVPSGEGVDVAAGADVIMLDARPYEAALGRAGADLARDKAMAADFHQAAEQYETAMHAKAMPQRTSQEAQAKALAADASVAADESAVQTAKLNLEYCRIGAPFAGRLGSLMVKPGSVVKENETDLISLVQITPIDVGFSVPEERLAAINRERAAGKLELRVEIPGDSSGPMTGAIEFVDNRVDPATGTIRLKARFENADRRLWPGQFVNATLNLGRQDRVVLVPTEAVQAAQSGSSVFVVKADQTVELRQVTPGIVTGGQTVIEKGVSAGETVVTDGQLRLAPGMAVEVRPSAAAAAAGKP